MKWDFASTRELLDGVDACAFGRACREALVDETIVVL